MQRFNNKIMLVLLLLSPFVQNCAKQAPYPQKEFTNTKPLPVTAWNFDWDDNIFIMPTKILLWDRENQKEVGVSTAQWALIRQEVGKPGPWEHFELRPDLKTGSLRYFADENGEGNVFLKDVLKAMQGSRQSWQGPSWSAFLKALSRPESAAHTAIITARLHAPHTIYEALVELQRRKIIIYLPPESNIFPVAYPKFSQLFGGSASSPSEAKVQVMKRLLDTLEATPTTSDTPLVTNREGTGRAALHLWGFSDDDFGNFSTAVSALSEDVRKARWPHVKITIFFTGTNHPTQKSRAVAIMPDGRAREVNAKELEESDEEVYRQGLVPSAGQSFPTIVSD